MGYTPAAWATFGGALAAVAGALTGLPFVAVSVKAGALTGLLFVAVSVKASALSESLALRSRAAETLVLFMISVMIAVVLVGPPNQRQRSAGNCWRWRCYPVSRCSRW